MKKTGYSLRNIFLTACLLLLSQTGKAQTNLSPGVSKQLFDSLAFKDSLIFNTILSTCKITAISALFSDDFEFLQDDGGPIYTTRIPVQQFLTNSQSFCERINSKNDQQMKRIVVAGTLQVYPTGDNGAIQMGLQHFIVTRSGQPDELVEVSKFINTWLKEDQEWKLSKQFISQQALTTNRSGNALYDTIAKMDSILFSAINSRDLAAVKSLYSKNLEFFHDKGGKMSYERIIQINKENFAKPDESVRRELDKATLEIYPIKEFGAIEIGVHKFYTKLKGQEEKLTASPKFIQVWQKENEKWKVIKVISYGHQ